VFNIVENPLILKIIMNIREFADPILKDLGKRIRHYRNLQDITIDKLAERCDPPLHYNYVGGVERGEYNLSLAGLLRISRGLKIPLEKLLEGLDVEYDKTEKEQRINDLSILLRSMELDQIDLVSGIAKEIVTAQGV